MRDTILLVEDEEMMSNLYKAILEREGFQTRAAKHGADAIEKIAQYQPSLILLDIRMPYLNGIDVCRAVRETTSKEELPIIVITAYADNETKRAAFDAGANVYLTKPVKLPIIVKHVRDFLPGTTQSQPDEPEDNLENPQS